ncbi:MAG: elongation factor P [Myxococcota bacterium]|jgi:elongation factor P
MYQTSDIKKGLKIKMDGTPWNVIEFLFVKPGKGTAFTRTKLKNLVTGRVIDRNFRSGETLEPVDVEHRTGMFMYNDGQDFIFMDTDSYEQFPVSAEAIGNDADFLLENSEADLLFFEGRPITIGLPNFVEVEITYCEPAVKGDTATNTTKAATIATGAQVQVPLFIEDGTVIKIDTRTREYCGRVSK